MEEIVLTSDNYKNNRPLEVLAFTYAELGAMGDPGKVVLIDYRARLFRFYLQEDDLKLSEVAEFFPEFSSLISFPKKALFSTTNGYLDSFYKDWSELDLGMGNHLIFKSIIKKDLTEELLGLESYERFRIALETVLKAVKNKTRMKVVVRCIYYKPATPPCDIIDMEYDTWIEFLNADQIKRKAMVLRMLNRPNLRQSSVREIAWIPLGGQNKLREVTENER